MVSVCQVTGKQGLIVVANQLHFYFTKVSRRFKCTSFFWLLYRTFKSFKCTSFCYYTVSYQL